jgi:hypothetical protein
MMSQRKVTQLLKAMTTVHRLCRELELPEVICPDEARTVITACIQRGSKSVRESIMAAFGDAGTVQ